MALVASCLAVYKRDHIWRAKAWRWGWKNKEYSDRVENRCRAEVEAPGPGPGEMVCWGVNPGGGGGWASAPENWP